MKPSVIPTKARNFTIASWVRVPPGKEDFREFIKALNDHGVQYLLVGGYAVIIHGYRRTTGVMDIWVNPVEENYTRLMRAFTQFGLPLIPETDFLHNEDMDVFGFGRAPVSIDILKQVKGCAFDEAFAVSQVYLKADLPVRYIQL